MIWSHEVDHLAMRVTSALHFLSFQDSQHRNVPFILSFSIAFPGTTHAHIPVLQLSQAPSVPRPAFPFFPPTRSQRSSLGALKGNLLFLSSLLENLSFPVAQSFLPNNKKKKTGLAEWSLSVHCRAEKRREVSCSNAWNNKMHGKDEAVAAAPTLIC